MALLTIFMLMTVPQPGLPPSAQSFIGQGISEFEQAYDHWEVKRFEAADRFFEQAIKEAPDHYLAYYWKGVTHFFRTIYFRYALPADVNKKLAEHHIEAALDDLNAAIQRSEDGESYALLATLTGMKIDLKPWTAVWLGPQVMKYKEKAQTLAPDNPRAHYLLGVSYFYGPGFMGGKSKGLDHLLRAEKLFEGEASQPEEQPAIYPRWGQSTCLVFIARLYKDQSNRRQALRYYQKALTINPVDLLAQTELAQLEGEKP